MRGMLAILLLIAQPALAQDLVFSIAPTQSCLASTADPDARRGCAGKAAAACINSNSGGETTYGMGFCLDNERKHWDAWLNAAYGQLMTRVQTSDAEMTRLGSAAPRMAPALREMQRKWIAFRDAKCEFEMTQWGGGTGGGPATVNCLLHTTADQAIFLEQAWLGD